MSILLLSLLAAAGPSYVVGGQPAEAGSWPQTAAFDYNGSVACSGVLIHPEWVLTAGHCAPTVDWIHLDTTDLASPGESVAIDDFVVHPDAFRTFDVALAHLAQPSSVEPMPLALDCIASQWIRADEPLVLTGFGATDTFGSQAANGLEQADIQIEDPVCSDIYRGCNTDAMPAGELIAGGGGVDSCSGDSGGPIYLFAAERYWLAGTTSRAATPAAVPCGDGGIYVRADAIAAWIEDTTGATLARPNCDGLNLPPSLEVVPFDLRINEVGRQEPAVVDANLDQGHTLTIAAAPAHGWAAVANGEVVYAPAGNFVGTDRFEVEVWDDGTPPERGAAWVEVSVHTGTGEAPGCGCRHGGAPGAGWLLLLLGYRRR